MNTSLQRKISVIGLGYVGLPMAVEFGLLDEVIAFDINPRRVAELKKGIDHTGEVTPEALQRAKLQLTTDASDLRQADFHIITVPTPINEAKQPDLGPLLSASKIIGEQLQKGAIVAYESTVYPGATEEECVPVLEQYSGLKCGKDFFVGYSPERINPGDKEHTFKSIKKVVAGQNPEILDIVANVYSSVVTAGVHKASSIKVAEAAKVIENTQRDINIALMNELAVIFEKIGIDTTEVLEAAGTKWNFLPFRPGLVGGHCIGVDPYYLTYKANIVGVRPEVILSGRRTNDNMGKYIAEQTVKQVVKANKSVNGAKVAVLGLTFKENCPDIRNTRVIDIVDELKSYHVDVLVNDLLADVAEAQREYGISLVAWDDITQVDAIILAVAHDKYIKMSLAEYAAKLTNPKILIDVKSVFDSKQLAVQGIQVWRL